MFDFSPNGLDPAGFFVYLGIRWAGYTLFLGVASYLGRRLGDWRIPALAALGLVLPDLGREVMGPYRRSVVGMSLEVWSLASASLVAAQWLLYAAVIMRSARLVRQRAVKRVAS